MADEIKLSATLAVAATNYAETIAPGQINIDLPSGPDLASEGGTQSVGTSMSSLQVGNLGSSQDGGVFFFRNLDATDNIEIGEDISGFKAWILLKPGEYAIGRLSARFPASNAIKVKASANSPVLQYRIFSGGL
tara:strand:+ start:4158 stop:4559 length:402 start_codon:yes stop_codon:yes gene_type:complete